MGFLSHVKITVKDFDRARNFYEIIFKHINVKKNFEAGEKSEWRGKIIGYGAKECTFEFQGVNKKVEGLNKIGLHHIAFNANSRGDVDKFYAFLLKNKIKILYKPKEYSYVKGYYAVFFFDADGNVLEYCYIP